VLNYSAFFCSVSRRMNGRKKPSRRGGGLVKRASGAVHGDCRQPENQFIRKK
jgi:hypothetical protein